MTRMDARSAASGGDRVLITGGAGFIGSHLADDLIRRGHFVRILDVLHEQVHDRSEPPPWLNPAADLVVGDVADRGALEQALEGIDVVFHFAARVGVGQSMYEMVDYVDGNDRGTACLMACLAERPVRRLVVASSMSVYGEGRHIGPTGQPVRATRPESRLLAGLWDAVGPAGEALVPAATTEETRVDLRSVYALTKYAQEQLCLIVGQAYGIPCTALRFFNVYGERQALSNPYTGVLAIFAARLLNGRPPLLYEDGAQRRDFVHVSDVVAACRLAMSEPRAAGETVNIGSGHAMSVREVAVALAAALGRNIGPEVTGRHRRGDARHCYADIGRAREVLGFRPRITPAAGIASLASWLGDQRPRDGVEAAAEELRRRGLAV